MIPNLIIFSRATYVGAGGTSVATPAATYAFFTRDYKPPEQERYIDYDIVKNQNGKFKWIYDNGPGFKAWDPFAIICENEFANMVGFVAATQFSQLKTMWEHKGTMGMQAPEGTYFIHWAKSPIGQNFRVFPSQTTDDQEFEVIVQFEEA